MINLKEYMVVEANTNTKSTVNPRRGATIYILKDGDSKCVATKVVDTKKVIARSWDKSGKSYNNYITLSDNEYGIKGYEFFVIGSIDYKDKDQVTTFSYDGDTYYAGISAQAIKAFIDNHASDKLSDILSEITELEEELAGLYRERDELQAKINTEITESLQNGKQNI